MTTMDEFKEICGVGTVVVSIRKEHIDKVFKAIGNDLPNMMSDWMSGFVLLWEDVHLDSSTWYTNLVDLLKSIEEEFDDSHFSIEVATWTTWDGYGIEYTFYGGFGGFEPVIKYDLCGTEVDPLQFTKKE